MQFLIINFLEILLTLLIIQNFLIGKKKVLSDCSFNRTSKQ